MAAVVVLKKWPLADPQVGAAVMAKVLGGVAMDHARHLGNCRGIAADGIPVAQAKALQAAFHAAQIGAWAAASNTVPQLPSVVHASRIDPRHRDGIHCQVALAGPPDVLPWDRVVLVLPAMWRESKTVRKGSAPAKPGMIKKVASAGPAGMAMKALKSARPSTGGKTEIDTSLRPMVLIVCAKPLMRIHAFADRLDYQVLGNEMGIGLANFHELLGKLRQATRPDIPSRGALDRYLANRPMPSWLSVNDNATLGLTARWLFLRGEIRRKMQGSAAPPRNIHTTFEASAGMQAQLQRALAAQTGTAQTPQPSIQQPSIQQPSMQAANAPSSPGFNVSTPMTPAQMWERHGQTYPVGNVIFEAGDQSREMYVIQSGEVQISIWEKGQERIVARLGAGDFVGEMAVLNGDPRSATASVSKETRMLVFDPQSFANLIRGNSDVAVRMVKKMAGRLRTANQRIAQLLVCDPVERVLVFLAEVAERDGFERGKQMSIQANANDIVVHVGLPLSTVEEVLVGLERDRLLTRRDRVMLVPTVLQLKKLISDRQARQG
jgi:CRP/FNR family transcriptional regulator, cyclic AMP receptor protein